MNGAAGLDADSDGGATPFEHMTQLSKQELDSALAMGGARIAARFEPVSDDEGRAGGKLSAIGSESVFAQVGLRDGDIMRSVDGEEVGDLVDLLRSYTAKKPGETLRLELERDEQPFTISLLIE